MNDSLPLAPPIGVVDWIGLRPERIEPPEVVASAIISTDEGLIGDHFAGKPGSDRQVTLIQAEHLPVVAAILQRAALDPGLLRRNIIVRGINLLSLLDSEFQIGDAVLYGTSDCPPCQRMNDNLGPGGIDAMLGHGGITARVVQGGTVKVGDAVRKIA